MARPARIDLRRSSRSSRPGSRARRPRRSSRRGSGLSCGGERWLIRLADAAEVVAVPPIAAVPLTQPWFLGLANIRGNLYSVVDFAGFLGRETVVPHGTGGQSRLILFGPRAGDLKAGIVVQSVLGLRNLAELDAGAAGARTRPRGTASAGPTPTAARGRRSSSRGSWPIRRSCGSDCSGTAR